MNAAGLTKNQIDKLGNTLIFLSENIKPISKTHFLKLIFIIEEISIKKYGIPFFNLKFDVWKLGPVNKDLFAELSGELTLLSEYICRDSTDDKYIVAKKKFSDDEFSDSEISLLEEITNRFKYCTANELINFTHRKGTPWYDTAVQYGILELLEAGKINTTDYSINLSKSIEDDERKLSLYKGHQEFFKLSKSLKQ